jgi:release factor glutamine methyltransferase
VTSIDWLLDASAALQTAGIESPQREARIILGHMLGKSVEQLVAGVCELDARSITNARTALNRRIAGEPSAYIVGVKEFYGRPFKVDKNVLIPRPETESLVEAVIERLRPGDRCADVGTGSGCIGISCALERPESVWLCSDVSADALMIARENADTLGARVEFQQADLLDGVANGSLALIASNPPYIAEGDPRLDPAVREFEPESALLAGEDGLQVIRRLVEQACRALMPGGTLAFEFGAGQAVDELLRGWETVILRDLAGIDRVAVATKPVG